MRMIVMLGRAAFTALLALSALIAAAPVSHAQISGTYTYDSSNHAYFVQGDTTVDGDISGNDVFVGKDNATSFTTIPSGITLNVNAGATITTISGNPNNPYPDGLIYRGLNVFGANQANITSGSVTLARGYNTTSLNITNGSVFQAESHDSSKSSISIGNVTYAFSFNTSTTDISSGNVIYARCFNTSTMNITGGSVQESQSNGGSILNISGGNLANAYGLDNSVTNVAGGSVGVVRGEDASTINIAGGSVTDAVGEKTSTTNITGGNVSQATGIRNSIFNISGGSITDLYAYDNSVFNVTGGTIGTNTIRLFGDSVLNLSGSGLTLSSAVSGSDGNGSYSDYLLAGVLQGGQSIDGVHLFDYLDGGHNIAGGREGNTPLYFNGAAQFTAVSASAPEPSAFALILVGLLPFAGVVRWRRINV